VAEWRRNVQMVMSSLKERCGKFSFYPDYLSCMVVASGALAGQ